MNKLAIIILAFCILSFASVPGVHAAAKMDVVVVGDLSHGPMQPSIRAIKEVTSKYGDQINVVWLDLDNADGIKYAEEHGLSAHLNILINGHYQFLVNGRKVTFQWFEGTEWTKNDLDAVLSGLLNNTGNVTPLANPEVGGSIFDLVTFLLLRPLTILAIAVVVGALFYFIRRSKKRKGMRSEQS